ncbi:glutamate racemase [Paraferrimonas sp. SM1919]|uniref:glutamate racemase n=1 Tax=Paraferrimonas sp. SM1919 TaxID=2662263 RepID=UPI0013CFD0F3|nr:glutamate racemase [Paraferrimonas sp. SM1919]
MYSSILVFDSGVGGLSIVEHLQDSYKVSYLADDARLPYGELADDELVEGAVKLIKQVIAKQPIDAVIVACNSASTLILPHLRMAITQPVVGVVPAIKPAAACTKNNKITLLATPGTVRRQYTKDLINEFAKDKQVQLLGCSQLVHLAEAKLSKNTIDVSQLQQQLLPVIQYGSDVVVLGCTHFPLLAEEIQDYLGEQVKLIDSSDAIRRRVEQLLPMTNQAELLQAWFTSGKVTMGKALKDFGFKQTEVLNSD